MIILTGRNLGERQRDLNTKVKEATEKNVDFKQIRDTPEECDVDKLFKIDLASNHKNVEYIIEVLKSGDSLYISRALKCTWLYDDDFENFINPDNLHNNVMPFMSTKMKKKLLTSISTHVRCENRAALFYKYCMDIKFTSIALKFLNFTSEAFKLELLQDKSNCDHLIVGSRDEYLKHFIGPSFILADAYVAIFHGTTRLQVFRELGYLYSVSDVKYLDLVEKSVELSQYNNIHLGLRISKRIIKKNKDRVLKNPSLYVKILSKSVLVRHTTAEDAKIFAVALLPNDAPSFWNENYCYSNKFFLDKITDGKFKFIKEIFTSKYPKQEFETSIEFYNYQCYYIMTLEERETWALNHLASEAEILGIGQNYLWYKFVSFEKAFEDIKKLVMITADNTKRSDMLNILVESAKNQRDVEKLMKHYYERHVNELRYTKEMFLDRLLQNFNIYEFDADCWAAWNKMFHNLEVYSLTDCFGCKTEYKIIALVYSIIHKNDIHEALKLYIDSNLYFYALKCNTDRLPKEQQEMVFNYLFKFYMDKIINSENEPYDDDMKHHLRKYIHSILDLLQQYDRTGKDVPEIVNHFMKLDWDEFRWHRLITKPADSTMPLNLLRDLKKDATLLVENLPRLKLNIDDSYRYNISMVLKKLKIYFSNDIAKDYLRFFDELLTADKLWHKAAQAAAHGIFQLGDESLKVDFMKKYAPTEPKINYGVISEKLLRTQEAICYHACYSRPPVPLKYVLMYIKGDYVHFCLPMFQSYLANLPLPLCMEFVEAILNTPVSIQKHGLRLAFECFNAESLNKLVLKVWKKTKNISLRVIIFKAIFNKISETHNQDMFYDTLKLITSTLREDDDDEVFRLLVSHKLPNNLIPEYIEAVWNVVSQLPFKPTNCNRMGTVINFIDKNIELIRQDFVQDIVETFIVSVLKKEEGDAIKISTEATSLIENKWDLTATYIIYVRDKDELDKKLKLTKLILNAYLGPLEKEKREKKYALRKHCFNFIRNLEERSYNQDFHRYENVNIIMQFVLQTLQDMFPIEEIYLKLWELRLGLMGRKVIADAKTKHEEQEETVELYVATKDIASQFANGLGNLIKEFVEKEIYFSSFSIDILHKIGNEMQVVKNQFDTNISGEDMAVAVSFELIRFEITEIYLLVLNFISARHSRKFKKEFKLVMDNIRKLDNKEIRCNLYSKFDHA